MVLPHINPSNFESVLNWRKFWRVCMGCYQTLIPYISIGNCNSELIFGMRASFRILCKNMTSYPIISKILFLWRHHFRTLDILFKSRVEATEQMTQNWTFCNSRINESTKSRLTWHVCSSYFLFAFYFTPENISVGNLSDESSAAFFLILWECHKM